MFFLYFYKYQSFSVVRSLCFVDFMACFWSISVPARRGFAKTPDVYNAGGKRLISFPKKKTGKINSQYSLPNTFSLPFFLLAILSSPSDYCYSFLWNVPFNTRCVLLLLWCPLLRCVTIWLGWCVLSSPRMPGRRYHIPWKSNDRLASHVRTDASRRGKALWSLHFLARVRGQTPPWEASRVCIPYLSVHTWLVPGIQYGNYACPSLPQLKHPSLSISKPYPWNLHTLPTLETVHFVYGCVVLLGGIWRVQSGTYFIKLLQIRQLRVRPVEWLILIFTWDIFIVDEVTSNR